MASKRTRPQAAPFEPERSRALVAYIKARAAGGWPDGGNVFWVGGSNEAVDLCGTCCEKKVKAIKRRRPNADVSVAGGFGCDEHDSPPYCAACHVRLSGAATNWGAREILREFLAEAAGDLVGPGSARAWAELAWAVEALTGDSEWAKVEAIVGRALAGRPS